MGVASLLELGCTPKKTIIFDVTNDCKPTIRQDELNKVAVRATIINACGIKTTVRLTGESINATLDKVTTIERHNRDTHPR